MLATTGPVHLTESFLEYRSAHAVAAGSLMIIGDGYYTGRWIAAACCWAYGVVANNGACRRKGI